jgi:hypothetical protein
VSKPRPCTRCGIKPIAYTGRAYCYDCVPRRRRHPWHCRRCGTGTDYFTHQLCRRCHRSGPVRDSCRDCLAWGVTRRRDWLCQACDSWRGRFPTRSECPSCRRQVSVNARGYCRLCSRQANLVRAPHTAIDVITANRHGQQLFFVDLFRQKRPTPEVLAAAAVPWPARYPVDYEQLILFDASRDLNAARLRGFAPPPLPGLAAALDQVVDDHAAAHGWGRGLTAGVHQAMHILLTIQDTPGATIRYSEAETLTQMPCTGVLPVLDVLAAIGMLNDDRKPPLDPWFTSHTVGLPEPMLSELREWFYVLRDGSTITPRTRPRTSMTARVYVAAVIPALRTWTRHGYQSLREVTRDDVLAILPTERNRHANALSALRSLFRLLKARRITFINPVTRIRTAPGAPVQLVPMDLDQIRAALTSTNPARAAITALIAFHAPRISHLRALRLTDLRDGRLFLPQHTIVLAQPVRVRLAAWLDERARRWPDTSNPYLFIHHHNAVRTRPVSAGWITNTIGISAQLIRQDRILDEALVTNGDVRRICDMFGLTVSSAVRYTYTADPPDNDHVGSRTHAHS